MPTVFARQSTTAFSIVIAGLLILCIGLLVAVLKGQIYHENTIAASVSSHRVGVTTENPTSENNLPSVHQLPNVIPTNGENSTETVTEETLLKSSTWENFRLSPHVKPQHYNLLLHPNLKTDNFTGTVKITVNLIELMDHFVLHAFRLTVFNPRVYNVHENTEVHVRQTFLYDPHEFYVIELESAVKPGIYEIELQFSGSLVDKIVGFYKSRYVNSATNETRYLATSKFQPTYARRAFPCFDEPSFKSTFTVSLVHEPEYIALSNMPAEGTTSYLDGDLKITKFQKSVPMVTYLICFIVCDFEYQKTTTKGGKEFRVYATKDNVHSVEYAVDFGSKVLDFFENYFEIEYTLPKQDMVAIPDFVSGAMEHWGVITFRETNILYDPMKSSPQNKQRVSEVISHEMAHMWFGNLVTMEWWDDLWLNEGFASYIEYKGVDDLHPEWHMLEQFVTDSLQPVMDIDSTISSHPIVQSVSHPDEITEIFDDISYNKGASVLRMLEFFTGADTFREGISRFLKKYKYQNAKTQDLWEELSNHNQIDLNVSEIMGTWTQQMGFPFVTVTRDPQNPSRFKAKQQRFVKNREIYTLHQDDKEYIWHVPLSYITSTGETGIIWIRNSSSETFEIPVSDSDWVKFNINQTGYYIVNYDDEGWQRMIDVLMNNHEVLTPSDRSNLIFDAFLLAEAGHIKYDILLSMLTYLKKESHLVPWETAYASLVYLSRLLEATEVDSLIKRYINEITEPLYQKLGWEESEDHLDNLLRNTIIGLACHSGNKDCLDTTATLLRNWTTGFEIPTTLRRLVYHYGMKEIGNETYWDLMWNRYVKEESPQERKTLLYGLSHVRISTLIHRFLGHAMNESEIRRQDFFAVLSYLAGNPIARRIVWNFLRNKWEALVNRFSLNDRYLGLSVKKICTFFTTEDELTEMRMFFAKYPDAGAGKRRRQQALENVQNNIKWLKTYQDQMITLFLTKSSSPWLHYKLPLHIIPHHYDLVLQPDIEHSNFTGSVSINIEITTPSNYILTHARNLNISKTEITKIEENSTETPLRLFNYSNNTYWVIQFRENLPTGQYKLYFEFSGNFSDLGIFKEKYTDPNNTKRAIMATQFQDTYARQVFPCFDEPTFKTTFNISIVHSPEYTALSNTLELESEKLENGLTMTRFEKTVPMVIYLVCVIIGDVGFKETYLDSGARIRAYALSHNVEKTAYALKTGKALLEIFEKYFGYPYPLKKLDFISVPGGRFGMENWGLVLLGDAGMLADNSSSQEDIEKVTTLISHELSHMWFGNLVTMKWWDDLWLNEGFATYITYRGVDALYPCYDYMADFIIRPLSSALRKDATVFSRPIVKTARTSTEIGQMFDAISYDKGASILRMLETLMGDDFRNGVSAYLKKYAYQSVKTDDLWSELTLASRKELDVKMLMNTWTKQMNFPFINITRNETDRRNIIISQHRYVLKNESTTWEDDSPYNYIWIVPLTYHTSNNSLLQFVMLNSTDQLTMKLPESEWIKFNVNFTGYYLVNYDIKDWLHFSDILHTNHTIFSQMDRANLLHDSFALARAGHLSYNISLKLFSYLRNETESIPWSIASDILKQLKLVEHSGDGVAFREFVRDLSKGLYRKLAWKEAKDIPGRNLRNIIMEISCKYKNIECLREAKSLFKRWLAGESIDPEYRNVVYFYGIETIKDESSFNKMWEKYANETSYDEKLDILKGLANTRNYTHCEWLIRTAENESRIVQDDYFYLLKMMGHNRNCYIFVLDFVLKNWTQLQTRFPMKKRSMASLVKDIFRNFRSERSFKELLSFFKKYPDAASAKEKAQIMDGIWNRINWINEHGVTVHSWLTEHVYMPWFSLRLPDHTIPSKYDLRVHANISTGIFEGDVNITLSVVKATDYIVVHASTLDVTATELQDLSTSEKVQIEEEFPLPDTEVWVIRFLKKVPPGGYKLHMKYFGHAFSTTHYRKGVKIDTYTNNITKEEVPFLYTTFEPTYARKFFPCFDEPSLKASFRLAVIHDPHHVVISNMPVTNNFTRPDGLIQTQFMESVVMSTYLLCVVISDFTYLETDISHGKKLRFYAPPDRVNDTLHTLEVAPKFLEILEEYYGIPYQLPKLDFVAIPKFPSRGMENWGLIEYTDSLLVTEDMTRDKVFDSDRVVAHELAHMWFGNLVTMRWWNDLWLNEGFSSFAMFIPLRHLYHDVDEFAVLYSERGKIKDADYESRPIIHNVSNPNEIRRMFDEISYKKGSAVVKMLASFMKDDFRKGVMNYLKKYAFKNAETNDFWNELSSFSDTGINITEVMNTWTRQRGYPYVEIQVEDNHFTASQKSFLNTEIPEDKQMMKSDYGYTWKIPLTLKNIDTQEEQSYWFNEENATFPLNISADHCLKFNVNYSGYYIVKYDENGWDCLRKKLQNNHEIFQSVDRINILFDSFLLAEATHIMYDIPLELTKYLRNEKSFGPWASAGNNFFIRINGYLKAGSTNHKLFQNYTCYLIDNIYQDVLSNKTGRSDLDGCIKRYARMCQHPKYIESRIPDLNQWLSGQGFPRKGLGFSGIIPHFENETIWEELWKQFLNKNMSSHRSQILNAFSKFHDKELLRRTMNEALTNKELSKQDVLDVFDQLLDNSRISDEVWSFIKSNWTQIIDRTVDIHILLSTRGFTITTEEELEDLIKVAHTFEAEFSDFSYARRRLKWLRRNEETIVNWLKWNLLEGNIS